MATPTFRVLPRSLVLRTAPSASSRAPANHAKDSLTTGKLRSAWPSRLPEARAAWRGGGYVCEIEGRNGRRLGVNYAEIEAQWGNSDGALGWLEAARRLRDPGLVELKVNPLFDPLRQEPRFQAIERELKFPN